MLFEARHQKLYGATAILWNLFVFAAFFDRTSAIPQQQSRNRLSPRADHTPGLGVELETGSIVIQRPKDNNGKDPPALTPEQRDKIKGAEMTPIGFDWGSKTNWKLTAEPGSPELLPESIVDGLKNKVGDHKTASIGGEIYKFYVCLTSCHLSSCLRC